MDTVEPLLNQVGIDTNIDPEKNRIDREYYECLNRNRRIEIQQTLNAIDAVGSSPPNSPAMQPEAPGQNTILIVVISLVITLCIVAVVVVCLWLKRKKAREEEEVQKHEAIKQTDFSSITTQHKLDDTDQEAGTTLPTSPDKMDPNQRSLKKAEVMAAMDENDQVNLDFDEVVPERAKRYQDKEQV
jgi:hypothetical protein